MKVRQIILIAFMFVVTLLTVSMARAANPTIESIATIPAQDPTPGSTTLVDIWFVANDADGSDTLDNSTAAAYFNKFGEFTRNDTTCSAETINATAINYTCSVDMQFYDAAGVWAISVHVNDNESNMAYNGTTTFTYNTGLHMNMTPTTINFGTTLDVGEQDVASTDDPIVTQNIGNINITEVNVTAYDLVGETYSSYTTPAGNFECDGDDVADGVTSLINAAEVTIPGINIPRGESNTVNLYYHVDIPSTNIQVQVYSTIGGTAWVISVF